MITSWWPASLIVGVKPAQATYDVIPKPMSTCAKVCQVSKFLCTLLWASLLYGARGQLTEPFPAQFELSSLDGTNGFIIHGEAAGDQSGFSVSSAGDVNGDGLEDLVIGAYTASPLGKDKAGKSYLVFGSRSIFSGGTLELSSLDGQNGYILNGEAANDQCGFSVSSAGDLNGDSLSDFVIGATWAGHSGRLRTGKSYVVFGNPTVVIGSILDLSSLNGTNGLILYGEALDDHSGYSVSSVGDVNGDGLTDLVVGALYASPLGRSSSGKSYVIFGSRTVGSNGIFLLTSLNGSKGFILNGVASNDRCGSSVSSAGDVNGDGLSDLLIGAYNASPSGGSSAGTSYVVFGSRTIGSSGILEISSLNGSNGYIINGEAASDWSGVSVSSAGDVNGDGLSDLIVGALYASPSDKSQTGKSYVIFGSKSLINGGIVELSSLNGTNGFIINGETTGDWTGYSVTSAGDLNGDGFSDIVIGSPHATPSGRSGAGKSFVVFGSKTILSGGTLELSSLNGTNGFILNGEAANDESGFSVSSAGDMNGDGLSDIVIGAYSADPSGLLSAGKSYVIFGRNLTPSTQSSPTSKVIISSLTASKPLSVTLMPLTSSGVLRSTQVMRSTSLNSSIPSLLPPSTANDSTPLIAGIAAAVGAFACSLIAGGLFVWRKKAAKNEDGDNTGLKNVESSHSYDSISVTPVCQNSLDDDMQSARNDGKQNNEQFQGNYTSSTTSKSQSHYKEWPQQPAPSDPNQYTSIDKVEKQHDAYMAAKFEKAHENYDDLPT